MEILKGTIMWPAAPLKKICLVRAEMPLHMDEILLSQSRSEELGWVVGDLYWEPGLTDHMRVSRKGLQDSWGISLQRGSRRVYRSRSLTVSTRSVIGTGWPTVTLLKIIATLCKKEREKERDFICGCISDSAPVGQGWKEMSKEGDSPSFTVTVNQSRRIWFLCPADLWHIHVLVSTQSISDKVGLIFFCVLIF